MTEEKHGVIRSNMDTDIAPDRDFYQYASGGWIAAHPLKGEYARYGVFDDLREENKVRMRQMIDSLASNPKSKERGTVEQKINDLYLMGLDTERRNREGAAPLKSQLDHIAQAPADRLTELMAWAHDGLTDSFFSTGVGADPKDSSMNIMHIGEGGLGLGDRDFYLVKSEENDKILAAYRKYIGRIMRLAGYSDGDADRVVSTVMEIETELAGYKKTREERRNPLLAHNPRNFSELCFEIPGIDWRRYFLARGVEELQSVNIGSLGYLQNYPPICPP